jgi:hypothetical protein
MRRYLAVLLLLIPVLCAAQAGDTQQRPRRQGMGAFGSGVAGAITEIKPDSFTVKAMDGKTVTVKLNADTRFMKDRQPAKLADFKVGDTVFVGGEAKGDEVIARVVASRTAGAVGGGDRIAQLREGLGKTFIAGEVKAIEGTKLTILRPDGQSQTIEVDENTSFRKGRESITLPDIKVGDQVRGPGQVNSQGTFVATTLNTGPMPGEAAAPPQPAK